MTDDEMMPPAYEEMFPPAYEEMLPPLYSPAIEFYGCALMKTEFLTPYHQNEGNRSWKPILLELRSTQLKIYSLDIDRKFESLIMALFFELNQVNGLAQNIDQSKRSAQNDSEEFISDIYSMDPYSSTEMNSLQKSITGKLRTKIRHSKRSSVLGKILPNFYEELRDNKMLLEPSSSEEDFKEFKFKGQLLKSYTLSNSAVGKAPSLTRLTCDNVTCENDNSAAFVKYENVLRVRIELKQILLQFWSFYGLAHWFRNLTIGKDLSSPLEDRNLSLLKSIPGRNDRRNNALLYATAAAAGLGHTLEHNDETRLSCTSPFIEGKYGKRSVDLLEVSRSSSVVNSLFSLRQQRSDSFSSSSDSMSLDDIERQFTRCFDKWKMFSLDRQYSFWEKQYISNCIPDLNSYDRWSGKRITLSNYFSYLNDNQKKEVISKGDIDLLISSYNLHKLAHKLDKLNSKGESQCHSFLVHSDGLVSVLT